MTLDQGALVAVGTTSAQLLPRRVGDILNGIELPEERYIFIQNPDTNTATIGFSLGGTAALTVDVLEPGESYEANIKYFGPVNAIASAPCNVSVIDR